MAHKKMTIQTTTKITVPAGTKLISNGEFLTLARKSGNVFKLFTCPIEEVNSHDYLDDMLWMDFTKTELKKIISGR